jgi:hypothetical protein
LAHIVPVLLSDLVIRSIRPEECDEIISEALNDKSLSGGELHRSLVASGAALGIDKLQAHVLAHLHANMGLLRKQLTDIDAAAPSYWGDDAGMSLIHKLRTPLVERMREHVGMFVAANAAGFAGHFGVSEKYVLARRIEEPSDTPDWINDGVAASMALPNAFAGFIMSDVSKMECPCISHLAAANHEQGNPPLSKVMETARAKYGSIEMGMLAFFKHALTEEHKRLDKFEAEFGNLDSMDNQTASEETTSILSKYLSGSVPPGGDIDPH